MPAASSSPIPAGLCQLAGSDPARPDELPGLLDRLRRLPDPRRRRGRRLPLSYVLALAACSVLAEAKSLTAIAEWAADAPGQLLLRCGAALRDPDQPYRAPARRPCAGYCNARPHARPPPHAPPPWPIWPATHVPTHCPGTCAPASAGPRAAAGIHATAAAPARSCSPSPRAAAATPGGSPTPARPPRPRPAPPPSSPAHSSAAPTPPPRRHPHAARTGSEPMLLAHWCPSEPRHGVRPQSLDRAGAFRRAGE
ncbi:transposase family protein [Streptomyces sp. NPDC056683]|uniref:transposase family protein n=1 Tax=Streptomyces sp. NPDC056683 TaxID=3345910 RepID=UPI00369BF50A